MMIRPGDLWLSLTMLFLWVLPPSGSANAGLSTLGTVVRVVDGDTIQVRVNDREENVRYIGVNTPETHHPTKGRERAGREATEVNRARVEGRTVRLELDVQERDRHGRLLAYVYVDDVMVNAELVRRGYAQVMTGHWRLQCVQHPGENH